MWQRDRLCSFFLFFFICILRCTCMHGYKMGDKVYKGIVLEWDLSLFYEPIFILWKNTGQQSSSSQHTVMHFHWCAVAQLKSDCLIFTLMLGFNTGNSVIQCISGLTTDQNTFSTLSNSLIFFVQSHPLPKKSNLIFLFSLSLYEKTKCNKMWMCSFYSPERGHKGNNIQSSLSGCYSVCNFGQDHYSVVSCYPIHVPSPVLISPFTSLTCNYVSHIKQQHACGMCE